MRDGAPRRRGLVSVAVSVLLCLAARAPSKTSTVPCEGGRFLVPGGLVDRTTDFQALVIAGTEVSLEGTCPPFVTRVARLRGGMRVRAKWGPCSGLAGVTRLNALVMPSCTVMRGTFNARKAGIRRPFAAFRSECHDNILDRAGGEQCDGESRCPSGARCTVDCTCVSESGVDSTTTVTSTTTTTTLPLPPVSFRGDVRPIFRANCALVCCHTSSTVPSCQQPQVGLDLDQDPGPRRTGTYRLLVNAASRECLTLKRVVPGHPEASYLVFKLDGAGPCFLPTQMPPTGPLPPAAIETIRRWVAEGAQNN